MAGNGTVYSSATGGSCKAVKQFLPAKGVPFTIKDIEIPFDAKNGSSFECPN